MNEQYSQFPGSHWVMVYHDMKKTYFIDCLGRDFTRYGFKFKTPIYQISRRLQYWDSKLCRAYVSWMQIGKRIRLERNYGLLYMGLEIQQQIHLRLRQGKTINSENNTRGSRNVEQFTRSVRSIQSSMIDTYKNRNLNQKNWCARRRIRIEWT